MKFWQNWSIALVAVLMVPGTVSAQNSTLPKPIDLNKKAADSYYREQQENLFKAATSGNVDTYLKPVIPGVANEHSFDCYKQDGIELNFLNLANKLSPNCWQNKTPTISTNIDHHQLLKDDYKICGCLRSAMYGPIKRIMSDQKIEFPVAMDVVKEVEKNAEELKKELERDRNLLAFQALVISKENDFAKPFASKPAEDDQVQKIVNGMKSRVMKRAEDKSKLTEGSFTPSAKDQILRTLQSIEIPPRVNGAIFKEKDMKPGQCVDQREYLAMKQLPIGDEQKEIAATDLANFKESDWDYENLRGEFKKFMDMNTSDKVANKDKIMSLKAKIRFLDRNPILKTMLSLDSDLPFLKNMGDSPEKKKLVESKDQIKVDILGKKKELLTIIKNFTATDDQTAYEKALKKFYVGGKVSEMMDIAIESAALKKIEKFADKSFSSEKKKYYTKTSVYANFMERTKLKSPETCYGADSKVEECVSIFAPYCRDLDRIIPNLGPEGEDYMMDDLDELAKNDGETDIEKNPELQAYNELVCKDFERFRNQYCAGSMKFECLGKTSGSIRKIRKEYFKTKDLNSPTVASNERRRLERYGQYVDTNSLKSTIDSTPADTGPRFSSFKSLRETWELPEDKSSIFGNSSNGSGLADFVNGLENPVQNMAGAEMATGNASYQTALAPSTHPEQKIENMNEEKRRDLLDDWKKEFEDLKDKKAAGSSIDSSKERELQSRIDALEKLLADQKITKDQFDLLNRGIASQNQAVAKKNSSENDDEVEEKAHRTAVATAGSEIEAGRSPASVANAGFQQTTPQTASSAVSRKVRASADSSADSVAREEAKLVSLRNHSDGSITIESTTAGGGNAITVPVTDEQYKLLQTNPTGLNLSQIEQKIPKDQIAKLEKNGQIIILLRNGSNPPFEVKVERKNNKLVFRLKDEQGKPQAPVRRVYTRQALELQLKAQQ